MVKIIDNKVVQIKTATNLSFALKKTKTLADLLTEQYINRVITNGGVIMSDYNTIKALYEEVLETGEYFKLEMLLHYKGGVKLEYFDDKVYVSYLFDLSPNNNDVSQHLLSSMPIYNFDENVGGIEVNGNVSSGLMNASYNFFEKNKPNNIKIDFHKFEDWSAGALIGCGATSNAGNGATISINTWTGYMYFSDGVLRINPLLSTTGFWRYNPKGFMDLYWTGNKNTHYFCENKRILDSIESVDIKSENLPREYLTGRGFALGAFTSATGAVSNHSLTGTIQKVQITTGIGYNAKTLALRYLNRIKTETGFIIGAGITNWDNPFQNYSEEIGFQYIVNLYQNLIDNNELNNLEIFCDYLAGINIEFDLVNNIYRVKKLHDLSIYRRDLTQPTLNWCHQLTNKGLFSLMPESSSYQFLWQPQGEKKYKIQTTLNYYNSENLSPIKFLFSFGAVNTEKGYSLGYKESSNAVYFYENDGVSPIITENLMFLIPNNDYNVNVIIPGVLNEQIELEFVSKNGIQKFNKLLEKIYTGNSSLFFNWLGRVNSASSASVKGYSKFIKINSY
jgi:hypothetical protein